jgi:hypothetical protein
MEGVLKMLNTYLFPPSSTVLPISFQNDKSLHLSTSGFLALRGLVLDGGDKNKVF